VNDSPPPSADLGGARRRLLKGSFAVPAALTLASGTAFAAGSTAARCVSSSAGVGNQPLPGAADTLIRVPAYAAQLTGSNACSFVKGSEVAAKLGTSSGNLALKDRLGVSLTNTGFLCVVGQTKGSPSYVKNTVYASAPSLNSAASTYYAILVDASGNITGISGVSTVAGGAVSNNCWQSFGGLI